MHSPTRPGAWEAPIVMVKRSRLCVDEIDVTMICLQKSGEPPHRLGLFLGTLDVRPFFGHRHTFSWTPPWTLDHLLRLRQDAPHPELREGRAPGENTESSMKSLNPSFHQR